MDTRKLYLVTGLLGLAASIIIGRYCKQIIQSDFLSGIFLGIAFSGFLMYLIRSFPFKRLKE